MRKVAVFGNTGGDKWLARKLAEVTGLPLYPLDLIQYVDLPLFTHFRWVTKRLLGSALHAPEGWPAGSPMIRSTLDSYRVLWLCHRHLTPQYRAPVAEAREHKRVHHLRSPADIAALPATMHQETGR